jgi:hypothetical protein
MQGSNLIFLLIFVSLTCGSPAGDRISVKKRANNLPVISGDEDVASLQMLKQKKWPQPHVEVKQIEAWGPDHPYNRKQMEHEDQPQPMKRLVPGGMKSFSEHHSSVSQYSNMNGNVLSKSDQQHQASEDGNLLASYHRANMQQANKGQDPTHEELTEYDIPNENIHKKILNNNGRISQFNQALDNTAQFGAANLSPAQFMAANQEPSALFGSQQFGAAHNIGSQQFGAAHNIGSQQFGAANNIDSQQFEAANGMESLYIPSANGVQFEEANQAQKRSQDDKVNTAEEMSRYILQTGDEEGVANYFQQLIMEGQMDEYEALDYLNLITSLLSEQKERELELD